MAWRSGGTFMISCKYIKFSFSDFPATEIGESHCATRAEDEPSEAKRLL
jgi:hypothetical protein